jgi:dienelactone hydrolase
MNARLAMISVLTIGLGAGAGAGSAQVPDSAAIAGAERFMNLLHGGEWVAAEQMVAPPLRDRLGAAALEMIWGQMTSSWGAFGGTRQRAVTTTDSMKAVELLGDFANDTVVVRVVLSPALEVAGFWVAPVPEVERPPTPGPSYADESKFREVEVEVGSDPWVLPATLTIPAGAGRFPAIVLVHGSGPHDRDETVGGTKVFRDLAWGLASRGIAVLRYEKRTKTHGAKMGGDITLDSEVIVDALAGLELVRSHASVDPDQVYVLGHSLGAMLAPEIARRDGRLAGAIMMAGTARPIDVVMVGQLEYLAGLPMNAAPEAQAQLGAALAQVRRLASREAEGSELVLGAPASYFYALADRDDVAEALRVDAPLLLLQGERDYQVTVEDFELWRSALKERPATSFRSFPSLNHLFVAGSGLSTPVEYAQPGFVSEDVIATIHDWVTAR